MSSTTRSRLVSCLLVLVVCALLAPRWATPSSASYVRTSATQVAITSAPDWTPPTVAVTDPGSPLKGTVTVAATATDGESGIASVTLEHLIAGAETWTALCTDSTAPYSCSWNTGSVPDGHYELRARAVDGAGFGSTSVNVSTIVANSPVVVLSDPGDTVRGTVPLQVTVYSGTLLSYSARVEYAVSGSGSWKTMCNILLPPFTCSWNTTDFTSGTDYDLRAIAISGATSYTSAVVGPVLVDNVVPTVTMTDPGSPLAGTRTFSATATDTHSGVAQVALQYMSTGTTTWKPLCSIVSSPWSCSVATSTLPDGSYAFRAVATDVAGNQTTSAAVTNRVVDNTISSVSLTDPGAFLAATVTLSATGSSTAGITSVLVQRAPAGTTTWTDICTDTVAPYACAWNTLTVTDGPYDLRAVLLDGSGKTTTSAVVASRRVDNSPFRGVGIQATNGGANIGKLEASDSLTLTYSRQLTLSSVTSGWTGAPLAVTVRLRDGNLLGIGSKGDTIDVQRSGGTVNLGSVNLKEDFIRVSKTVTYNATITASAVVVAGVTQTVVTVTLGAVASGSGLRTTSVGAAMVWTPSGSTTDVGGTLCSVAPVTETGALDRDF